MQTHTDTAEKCSNAAHCSAQNICASKKEAEISQALIVNAVKRSLQGSSLPK